jgi:hypothetical protein
MPSESLKHNQKNFSPTKLPQKHKKRPGDYKTASGTYSYGEEDF